MIVTAFCLIFLVSVHAMKPDEVNSFFLKAPKSVPRAGRSAPGQYDSFFVKASKSVPRIGRRDGSMMYATDVDYSDWSKINMEKMSPQPEYYFGEYDY